MEKEVGNIEESIVDTCEIVNEISNILKDQRGEMNPYRGDNYDFSIVSLFGFNSFLTETPIDDFEHDEGADDKHREPVKITLLILTIVPPVVSYLQLDNQP